MKNKFLFLSFISLLNLSLGCITSNSIFNNNKPSSDTNQLILNTLNGKILGKTKNVEVFYPDKPTSLKNTVITWKSVPYAEPPVAGLRFKDPVPVKSWTNIRDGTVASHSCIQFNEQKIEETTFSEDCLYLNIELPYSSYQKSVVNKDSSALLPIFVWIHGGGFIIGGAAEYDGSALAAMSNIIVITINYRLGVLGSLHLANTDAKGYQSLKDQTLALKWIYDNAERFGGDRNKITICGESAGSWSVGYHLLLKQSWPYFKNAILQSGTPSRVDLDTLLLSSQEASYLSIDLGKNLNCVYNNDNLKFLNCLNSIDANKLNDLAHKLITFPIFVNDNQYFDKHPLEYLKNGQFKRTNVMPGFTDQEYLSLIYLENSKQEINELMTGKYATFENLLIKRLKLKVNDTRLDQIIEFYLPDEDINNPKVDYFKYYVNILSDFQYKCPTYLFADLISKYNNDATYVFEYAQKPLNSLFKGYYGAAHAEEIPFMFGNVLEYYYNDVFSKEDKFVSQKMVELWTNFIKYDKPTLNNEWLSYNSLKSATNRSLYYLKYNQNRNVVREVYSKTCQFWDSLNIITYRFDF